MDCFDWLSVSVKAYQAYTWLVGLGCLHAHTIDLVDLHVSISGNYDDKYFEPNHDMCLSFKKTKKSTRRISQARQ